VSTHNLNHLVPRRLASCCAQPPGHPNTLRPQCQCPSLRTAGATALSPFARSCSRPGKGHLTIPVQRSLCGGVDLIAVALEPWQRGPVTSARQLDLYISFLRCRGCCAHLVVLMQVIFARRVSPCSACGCGCASLGGGSKLRYFALLRAYLHGVVAQLVLSM
jgi:hypothetical protein